MRADFHTHTYFSADSVSVPEEIIEAAIKKGLRAICISDHLDIDYPNCGDNLDFNLDLERYVPEILRVQEIYRDQIEVLVGVEFGLMPHLGKVYKKIANTYPFDYIIGSVHVLDGMDPHYGQYYLDKTDKEGYCRAFEITLDNLKAIEDFDSLGHLDYIVRYSKAKEVSYRPTEYLDYIDEILKHLINHQKGLEINTGGWKYGLPFAHPHSDILKRYKELGGEIITVGSDGHTPEHIAYDFHKVKGYMEACGFRYYTEFRQRKPYFCRL